MPRKLEDLEAHAVKHWPTALVQRERESSVVPMLLASQEKFIAILYVADGSPTAWMDVLAATERLPGNLFLRHVMVLSDVAGEMTDRFRSGISSFLPSGTMIFQWKGRKHSYKFGSLDDCRKWTNPVLKVDGRGLARPADLSPAMQDVAMLLIHGGAALNLNPKAPNALIEKCMLGSLIGRKREIDTFVRQRYIEVSRVTQGATANMRGQLCQAYVREWLQGALPTWNFSRHSIPGISHNAGRTKMNFDLVARSPNDRCCAIEISFQETTNSTIERKAGQAADRQRLLRAAGHRIAYVIDGVGNFRRRSAMSTICAHSDCTVSFKDKELDALVKFLKQLK